MVRLISFRGLVKDVLRDRGGVARLIKRAGSLNAYAAIAIQTYGNTVLGLSTCAYEGPGIGNAGCGSLGKQAQFEEAASRQPGAFDESLRPMPISR
jgi:hypothetical protein